MKPRDLVKITYPNGVSLFWEVASVLLGGERQESVIELTPINQTPNGWGKTLCPSAMLDVMRDSGTVTIYSTGAASEERLPYCDRCGGNHLSDAACPSSHDQP